MRYLSFFSVAIVSVLTIVGCAQGTADGLVDARPNNPGFIDANLSFPDSRTFPDSMVSTPDAFVPPTADANIPSTPDAASGQLCATSADCPSATPCCIILFCNADPGIPGICS
ncbi:MAG: hypothetical protein K8W52_42915 [Deltaproteobacteria bacterium]|nr:hypothetical protein [Deltaproteobacteria bacterium]